MVKFTIVLEHKKIYSKIIQDVPTLLSNVADKDIYDFCAFNFGIIDKLNVQLDAQAYVKMFFSHQNLSFRNHCLLKIEEYSQQTNSRIKPFTAWTNLILLEHALKRKVKVHETTISKVEFELKMFEALVLINQKMLESEKTANTSTASLPENIRTSAYLFSASYKDDDINNFDSGKVFGCQLIKGAKLLSFFQKEKPKLIEQFLKDTYCNSWEEYLKKIFGLLIPIWTKSDDLNNMYYDIEVPDENVSEIKLFDELSINNSVEYIHTDFTSLRARPLVKLENQQYRVICTLFGFEIFYKGLYFRLLESYKKMIAKDKFGDFTGYFGEFFSEGCLFYEYLRFVEPNSYHISGKKIKLLNFQGEPDYYIRTDNKILLFESKDVFIDRDSKTSCDFNILEKSLKEKFFGIEHPNGIVEKKAILQIIENIKKILCAEIPYDKDLVANSSSIYPILVVHHHQFDCIGLNRILNLWYTDELNNQGINSELIKPLTIMIIDDFIHYKNLFEFERISIFRLLDCYHNNILKVEKSKSLEDGLNLHQPFSLFFQNQLKHVNLQDLPNHFEEVMKEILK